MQRLRDPKLGTKRHVKSTHCRRALVVRSLAPVSSHQPGSLLVAPISVVAEMWAVRPITGRSTVSAPSAHATISVTSVQTAALLSERSQFLSEFLSQDRHSVAVS